MRGQIPILRDIVRIRDVQRTAAEHAARLRDTERRAAVALHHEAQAMATDMEAAWNAVIEAPFLDVTLLPAWNDALQGQHARVEERKRLVEESEAALDQAKDYWRTALLRKDIAEDMLSNVRQAARHKAEEHILRLMEDRAMMERNKA
jgi:hypothetical protein